MVECSHCGKIFKYESECKRHELSHLPGFCCDNCGKKFTYLSALRRHEKQHERTTSVQCDKCNHSFKDEVLLKRHIKYAHEGTHVCSECEAQFNSSQALRIHTLTHKPKSERRYSCSFMNCKKTFNFSHHLKYHEMTHTNSRQHFCNICGKGFIQSHNLKVHMKIHEPSKWLSCDMPNCKKKFVSDYARKRHHARHKKGPDGKESPKILSKAAGSSEGSPCPACGKCLLPSFYEEHKLICNEKRINISHNISISSLTRANGEEFEENFNQEQLPSNTKDTTGDVSTCRSILGKCLVTGDSTGNADCLCDQMDKVENNSSKDLKRSTTDSKKALSGVANKDNATGITCEDCACSPVKSQAEYTSDKKLIGKKTKNVNDSNNCMPEFEYGVNGIIKVINTIDAELEEIANIRNNNFKRKTETKFSTYDTVNIPFNSCKAVLGKCIVSGNGMMSDDCLCAKMFLDEPHMTSQEMEEITPQPSDSIML